MRECPILMAMRMVFLMPGLSHNDQREKAHNGKPAEHLRRCRPFVIDRIFIQIVIL